MYEGDGKTPEGNYFITNKNFNSKYYLSLLVSYPNDEDVFTALRMDKNPGGSIMVHGTNRMRLAGRKTKERK
jgi:murein L,D-transpeptidase YafK